MKRIALLTLVALALGSTAQAQTLIDFNELGFSPSGTHMPATYRELAWAATNWHFMSHVLSPSNTYLALSGSATLIRRIDGAPFFFEGATFWSRRGLDAKGDFYFVLSYQGKVVYNGKADKVKVRFTGTPTILRPPYTGPVDAVALAFDKPGRGGDWDHLALDNLVLRPIP